MSSLTPAQHSDLGTTCLNQGITPDKLLWLSWIAFFPIFFLFLLSLSQRLSVIYVSCEARFPPISSGRKGSWWTLSRKKSCWALGEMVVSGSKPSPGAELFVPLLLQQLSAAVSLLVCMERTLWIPLSMEPHLSFPWRGHLLHRGGFELFCCVKNPFSASVLLWSCLL